MTINLPPPLSEAGGNTVTERASDDRDCKTAVATATGLPSGRLRSAQPLDSKGCDRKRTHRPQEKGAVQFLLFGQRMTLSASHGVARLTQTDASAFSAIGIKPLIPNGH
jgi:hypothetical protein